MKCINRKGDRKQNKRIVCLFLLAALLLCGCTPRQAQQEEVPPEEEDIPYVTQYESTMYNRSLYRGTLYAQNLCVAAENVPLEGYSCEDPVHAAGLFSVKDHEVLYADRIHERLYPASTTKLMTAYLALKYGNIDDVVTIGPNALDLGPDAQVCGFSEGDRISLYDLLCGLLLWSGNDCGVAIAEHISGSVEAFAEKMNEEAWDLGATNSHFVNPHGLHQEDHYTTAYDLYLIFNACLKDQRFLDIISLPGYTATVTESSGQVRHPEWAATNFFSVGYTPQPEGGYVFGGKTGTTDEAGSCVILYSENEAGEPFISIIMGAEDRETLYGEMRKLLTAGFALQTDQENKSKPLQ